MLYAKLFKAMLTINCTLPVKNTEANPKASLFESNHSIAPSLD